MQSATIDGHKFAYHKAGDEKYAAYFLSKQDQL